VRKVIYDLIAMNTVFYSTTMLVGLLSLSGCASVGLAEDTDEIIPTVEKVDLERFMGGWYVIANIPTFLEKDVTNAIESYELADDGTVLTTFAFDKEGERKSYQPRGFIRDESNAHWGMQFVWPIKAEYRIVYVDDDYQFTIIGRSKRDYLWIMAREASIPEQELEALIQKAVDLGYAREAIQRVPQNW